VDCLSNRERQVLGRIAGGETTKEIAEELAVSESTVKFHVSNALRKLGAKSRSEAVAIALAKGCIRDHR
jgi:DNA-binding NarL/FixJ family response regulator